MWQSLRGHVLITGGSIAFAGMLALLGLAMTPRDCDAQSQADCHPTAVNVPTPATPAPEGILLVEAPAACHDGDGNAAGQDVSAGGYVKVGTTVHLHSHALVQGSCDIMSWNYSTGLCQHFDPQTRYLMGIDFRQEPPTILKS